MINDITHPEKYAFNENISSYQIASILDNLLFEAIRPLVYNTRIIQDWLAEMLPLIISDGRRKVSKIPTDQLVQTIFTAIMTKDPEKLLYLVQSLKLERNQIFYLVLQVQKINKSYIKDTCKALQTKNPQKRAKYLQRIQAIEEKLGADRKYWHQALQTCNYWIGLAFDFRRMIAEKYYKFAYKKAIEAEYGTGLNISVPDLYNNYILAIYRALDKYDSDHGMLSSYIALWFKNASSNPDFNHEVNVAFTIPASQRRLLQKQNWTNRKGLAVMNIANPINDKVAEQHVSPLQPNSSDLIDQISDLGKKVDLQVFLLLANIPFHLPDKDCKIIQRMFDPPTLTMQE